MKGVENRIQQAKLTEKAPAGCEKQKEVTKPTGEISIPDKGRDMGETAVAGIRQKPGDR